ncbi:NAD(P)H-quinone dehydrogenase [Canibacter sp. lx-45]|uniref:NAD(P)H-quinone dehydrogenase n=1 Tax=Canibacter zhuwentaonis TaxID=2837491 RepID=UPI001BDCA531|nr:NAD(P)H-quinone dehydrogenase [Canibacter zhuwentaonis]MBT1035742.1 NAD(P)H-quinone dehydrogenase [Canibacter zhuwentaonis]
MSNTIERKHRIVILGGGPGGYEAALVGAQLDADITLVEATGIGGSAVLTDVVPSKSLIATADAVAAVRNASELGVCTVTESGESCEVTTVVDCAALNKRLLRMAQTQSQDMLKKLTSAGVKVIFGHAKLASRSAVSISTNTGETQLIEADTIVIAVGASPRKLVSAKPDNERILTWKQLYNLTELPEHLIVVGSGVTGAEFASAYRILGSKVTLVSSRERVLPGEDKDAAQVLEEKFKQLGMQVLSKSRADAVIRTADGVRVELADGRAVTGSHCLMAVGSIPNTSCIGLENAGIKTTDSGHIRVNRVASTSVPSIYAAGDCTDFYPLASVAAMQGRTAIMHALGDFVRPIEVRNVTSNVFTSPEIATVGFSEKDIEEIPELAATSSVHMLPLHENPRAKMQGVKEGFVKIIASKLNGAVRGGVIVGPRASELIFALAVAVEHRLTVDQITAAFTVYPSMTDSISDVSRDLHVRPKIK